MFASGRVDYFWWAAAARWRRSSDSMRMMTSDIYNTKMTSYIYNTNVSYQSSLAQASQHMRAYTPLLIPLSVHVSHQCLFVVARTQLQVGAQADAACLSSKLA